MPQKDNETKRKIITIALELIKKNGYDNVTLNDICSAAGISKHTFYYYFSSKDQILLAFYEIPNEISSGKLTSILSANSNMEQFWQLLEPMIDFFIDAGPEIIRRVLIANITRDIGTFDTTKEKSDLSKARIALLKKAQESGEIRNSSDPASLLHAVGMQSMGYTTKWCISNGRFDLKRAVHIGIEVCLDVVPELRLSSSGESCRH